jgi:hypothetical protein
MVTFFVGHTSRVNPSGASPVLTHEQLWAGLSLKIRDPTEFVPIVASSQIISEEENVSNGGVIITRDIIFKDGEGPPDHAGKPVREIVKSYYPIRADYHQVSGPVMQNFITKGIDADGKEELFLSFVLEFRFPDLKAGSEEAKAQEDKMQKVR